ncbi:MAG: sugar kinase [Candidatus Bathyarchaeia archaeon]
MKPLDIISLGEPMVEFCATSTGSLKDVKLFESGWGGDTSNMAVAAARLNKACGYVCRIGDDEFGRSFLEMWQREKIDTSHVIIEDGSFTGVYFISIVDGGEHDFTYYRKDSAASHLSPDDIDPEYIKGSRIFHSSGISQAISTSCREAVFKAAEIAKSAGAIFSYDPNIRLKLWPINTARAVVSYTIEMADIIMPSMEDVKLITGHSSSERAAKQILKMGPRIVAIKLGAEGSLIATEDEIIKAPGFTVNVVDTTGAGDAFDGAFLTGILEGLGLEKTARFANATAALKTLGKGAVAPLPRRSEVEKFLRLWEKTRQLG